MQRTIFAAFALLALDCHATRVPTAIDARAEAPAPLVANSITSPPTRTEPLSFERAIGERMRAIGEVTVEIEMRSADGIVGHGSGVFVSPNGDVLTAAHVVRDPKHHFRILLPNGQGRDAVVVGRNVGRDVALLRAPGPPTAFAKPRAGRPTRSGWVVCAGFGGEVADEHVPMRTAGLIAEPEFAWEVTEYEKGRHFPIASKTSTFPGMVRTDCKTAPGMSGGPVVDLDGALVGVVVGSGGVISPIDAARSMLPANVRSEPTRTSGVDESDAEFTPVKDDEGRPSRSVTLASGFEGEDVKRSLFDVEVSPAASRSAAFTAVLVSGDGLAIAPSIRLVKDGDAKTTISASELVVAQHPGARCVEILAVRGELALLRCIGLSLGEHPLRPIESGHEATLGEVVSVVARSEGARTFGFVTAEERHPGMVAEDQPQFGCGTLHRMFAESHPAVRVGLALAHDAGSASAGALLVDRTGHPVAIDVASRVPGLSFAVRWSEVVRRFAPWLSHQQTH